MLRAACASIILLLLGIPAITVGFADALAGTLIEARLTGAVFAVAGCLMVTGAVGLVVKKWQRIGAPHLAFLGAVTAFLLSTYLFAQQLAYLEGERWLLLFAWALCGLASIGAVLLRPGSGQARNQPHTLAGDTDRTDNPAIGTWTRSSATLSSLAIPATLVFGIFQFWYGSFYTESQFAYALTLSQELMDQGLEAHNPTTHSFLAHFHVKNPTGHPIQIIRTDYELYGSRVAEQAGGPGQFGEQLKNERTAGAAVSARYVAYGPSDLLEVGTATGPPGVIEPSAEVDTRLAVGLPESVVTIYSHLALITTLLVSNDRLQLSGMPVRTNQMPCFDGYDECAVTAWKLTPPSKLWSVTRGEQLLETVQNFDLGSGGPTGKGFVSTAGSCIAQDMGQLLYLDRNNTCGHEKPDAENLMTLGFVEATTDLPLLERKP